MSAGQKITSQAKTQQNYAHQIQHTWPALKTPRMSLILSLFHSWEFLARSSGWATSCTALDTLSLSRVKVGHMVEINNLIFLIGSPACLNRSGSTPAASFKEEMLKLQSWELDIDIEKFPAASGLVLTATAGWFVTIWNRLP